MHVGTISKLNYNNHMNIFLCAIIYNIFKQENKYYNSSHYTSYQCNILLEYIP